MSSATKSPPSAAPMASVSARSDRRGAPFRRVKWWMTSLAMVMKATSTFTFDLAEVSKNCIWDDDDERGWKKKMGRRRIGRSRRRRRKRRRRRSKSVGDAGTVGPHLILVGKQLRPRAFDLSLFDHVRLVA